MEGSKGRGSKHRKAEEVGIYNSCEENYHQCRSIWDELLIRTCEFYFKNTCRWEALVDTLEREDTGVEAATTKRSAEVGQWISTECL